MRPERQHFELISIQAAADYCDVAPRTIRRWISAGHLKAFRLGPRLIKVDAAELDKLLHPTGGAA
jgi:excisionase family DNA binding protein